MSDDAEKITFPNAMVHTWWQRMGEIFGRMWFEQFGSKASKSWRDELETWPLELAGAVLAHYRRAGLKFPPTLSEVGKLARELKPSLDRPTAPRREYRPTAVMKEFRATQSKVAAAIEKYCNKNPGASRREACLAHLGDRGIVTFLPESILADERRLENERLRRDTTAELTT